MRRMVIDRCFRAVAVNWSVSASQMARLEPNLCVKSVRRCSSEQIGFLDCNFHESAFIWMWHEMFRASRARTDQVINVLKAQPRGILLTKCPGGASLGDQVRHLPHTIVLY